MAILFFACCIHGNASASDDLRARYIHECKKDQRLYQLASNYSSDAKEIYVSDRNFLDPLTFFVKEDGKIELAKINHPLYLVEIKKIHLPSGENYFQEIEFRNFLPEKMEKDKKAVLILFYPKGAVARGAYRDFKFTYYFSRAAFHEKGCPIIVYE